MPKSVNLKDLPDDVMEIVYDKQAEMKKIAKRPVPYEKAFARLIRIAHNCENGNKEEVK